ncbi:hypothetical protein LOK49_LG04G00348 [Camellia lanceoleosa]|uniref:Uncharacterized protein n=1 Tax=Camellia lanceoleosa TaxID=1840588 RepID=A0ACC0I5E2_9ERIC|nr:hypothetical protein LOK49_LG04G00348 [Camellia lanceoleosa]
MENVGHACKVRRVRTTEDKRAVDSKEKEPLIGSFCHESGIGFMVPPVNTVQTLILHDSKRMVWPNNGQLIMNLARKGHIWRTEVILYPIFQVMFHELMDSWP